MHTCDVSRFPMNGAAGVTDIGQHARGWGYPSDDGPTGTDQTGTDRSTG